MRCSDARDLISARLDREASPTDGRALDAHLRGCPACAAYRGSVERLHRALRVRAAEPVPDLSAAIVASAAPAAASPREWVRWALVVLAATELALAVPRLLGDDAHVGRHVGSLSAALAVGMLWAAWRPERAAGLVPVALALTACSVATAALDLADGAVGAGAEAHHVLEAATLVLLWLLAGAPRPQVRLPARRVSAAAGR